MNDLARAISDLSPAKREILLRQLSKRSGKSAPTFDLAATDETGAVPLSFGQQRLWFLQQLDPKSPAYNYPLLISLKGSLDVAGLEKSLNEILRRHDCLRTNFIKRAGQAVQITRPYERIKLPIVNLATVPAEEREKEALSLAAKKALRPYDLSGDLLWRTLLIRLSDEHHLLSLSTHHIVFDGWSLGILMRELRILYGCYCDGRDSPLEDAKFRYADYVNWQHLWLQGERLEKLVAYWRHKLKGAPQQLSLPADLPRPAARSFSGAQRIEIFPPTISRQLQSLSRAEGATLFMTLLAAFKVLLYGYTAQTDILIGTDTANRKLVETEELIGFFVNVIPLRTNLSGNPTFQELIARLRETALQAYAHEDLPFEKMVEELRPARSASYTPLVQALFLLQNNSHNMEEFPGLEVSLREIDRATSKFDLVVSISLIDEGIVCSFNYSTEIFHESTIAGMMTNYRRLLETVAAQPGIRLRDLSSLVKAERRQRIMAESAGKVSKFSRLRQGRRKAVDLAEANMVSMDYLNPDEKFPLVMQPRSADIDPAGWASENRSLIESQLLRHGAILFRGFKPDSPLAFEAFAGAICGELFGEYGDLPREALSRKIYGSTPYPPDQTILFHNESSHMHRWPLKQFFFCIKAAIEGGETPVVDCRKIYKQLPPDLIERFTEKQLMYARNFIEGLDVSWQDFFKTSDRAAVEEACRMGGVGFEWKGNDLKTHKVCAAIAQHPTTGEKVFFNQIQLHHISSLAPAVRQSILALFDEGDLPRNVFYGDGAPIEDSVIALITELYWKNAASFPWQEGDVLLLDNMLTAHARNPYTGPRKIVVAMGEMINAS